MSKVIALDAGHGLYTAGKRCLKALDAKETREWVLNDRIVDKLQKMLANYDCKVVRVDDTTGASDVALANRVVKANNEKADIYISVHHNAGINGGNGGGTVVYHYNDAPSKALAQRLYNAIVEETKLVGNRCDKTAVGDFYVINKTKMISLLVENGFMDSKVDVPIILTDAHATKTAQGILNFLISELNLAKIEKPAPSNVLYKVQVGAYSQKANADAMVAKLKKAGFDAIIITTN
jgi:N-acetylmuramoyl-L-alanine amidase